MSFSLFSKSSTPNSPDAKPGQPKEAGGPSVEKGSFPALAFLETALLIAHNNRSDTTQGSQTGPSGPAKPETEPASTADKSEPIVASASGTTSISIAFQAGRLVPPRLLLTPRSPQIQKRKAKMCRPQSLLLPRTPRNLSRHRRRAAHPPGLHLLPSRLTPLPLRSAGKPLPRAPLSKVVQLRDQIRVLILKKSGNQSPQRQRENQLILALARLNASGSFSAGGP